MKAREIGRQFSQPMPLWVKEPAGDIVMVFAEQFHVNSWPLGFVEELITSSDGVVGTISVTIASRKMVRDVSWTSQLQ